MDFKQAQAADAALAAESAAARAADNKVPQPGASVPQPQFGQIGSFFGSAASGWRTSPTGQGIEKGQTTLADLFTPKEELLTKEQWQKDYGGVQGAPPWYDGMSRASAELRLEHWATDSINNSSVNPNYFVTNLVGGIAGQAFDISAYAGEGAGVMSKAFEAGSLGARTFGTIEKVIDPGKVFFNTENKVMLAGARARYNIGRAFLDGTSQAGMQTLSTYNLANQNGYEYSVVQAVQDGVTAPFFNAAFALGAGAHARLNPDLKAIIGDTIARHSDAGSSFAEIRENVKANMGTDPKMREYLSRAAERAKKILRGEPLTPEDLADISAAKAAGVPDLSSVVPPEGVAMARFGKTLKDLGALPDLPVNAATKKPMTPGEVLSAYKSWIQTNITDPLKQARVVEALDKWTSSLQEAQNQPGLHTFATYLDNSDNLRHVLISDAPATASAKQDINTVIQSSLNSDTMKRFFLAKDRGKKKIFGGRTLQENEPSYLPLMRQYFEEHQNELVQEYKNQRAFAEATEAARFRKQKIITESTNVAQRRKAGVLTDDESWIADVYKKAFGVDVNFFSDKTSKEAGVYGFFHSGEPNKIYIRSGALMGGLDSMMGIAGHELGHSTSLTMPRVWIDVVDAMVNSGTNPIIKNAYLHAKDQMGAGGLWQGTPDAAMLDETFMNVMGQAIQTKDFWQSLYKNTPESGAALRAELKSRADAFGTMASAKSTLGQQLATNMAAALASADEARKSMTADPTLKYLGGYAYYGDRHLDFLYNLQNSIREDLFGDALPMVGEGKLRRRMGFVEFDEHFSHLVSQDDPVTGDGQTMSLNDRSGTPTTPGKYDISGFSFRPKEGDVRSVKDQMAAFIFNVVIAKSKDPLVQSIYKAWKENRGKDWWKNAGKELSGFNNMKDTPLIRIIPQKDGSFKIGLLSNDSGPIVKIDRATQKEISRGLQDKIMQGFTQELEDTKTLLHRVLYDLSGQKKFDPEDVKHQNSLLTEFFNSDEAQDVINEYNRVRGGSNKKGTMEIPTRSRKDTMLDAFVQAYAEFAKNKAEDAIRRSGLNVNAEDRIHQADVLAQWNETPEFAHQAEMRAQAAKLDSAWKKVAEENNRIAAKDGSQPRFVTRDQLQAETDPATVAAQFDQHMKETYQDSLRALAARILPTLADQDVSIAEVMKRIEADPLMRAELLKSAEIQTMKWAPGGKRSKAMMDILNDNATSWDRKQELLSHAAEMEENAGSGLSDESVIDEPTPFDNPADHFHQQVEDGVGMARRPNESEESASKRFFDASALAEKKVALKLDALRKMSAEALKREHATFRVWNEDYPTAAKGLVKQALDAFGINLDGEATDLAAKLAASTLDDRQKELVRNLAKYKAVLEGNMNRIDMFGQHGVNPGKDVMEVYNRNLWRLEGNASEALKATRSDFERASLSTMVQEILDDKGARVLRSLEAKGIKHVKAFLDGLPYKGVVTPGESVNGSRLITRERAQARLINVIERLNNQFKGFRDLWLADNFTRILELHEHGLWDGPPVYKKAFDEILEVLHQQHEALVGEANSLGSNIRLLPHYLWSHVHDRAKIASVSLREFLNDMKSSLNEREMARLHGPDWNVETWATQFYHEVTAPVMKEANPLDPMSMGNNLADPKGFHRTMVFEPGEASAYNKKYGTGNTATLIMSQLGRRAEQVGIMQMMGPNFEQTWTRHMAAMGGVGPMFHDRWVADTTFRHMLGFLDTPANTKLAEYGRAVRNWMNSAVAWLSGISSITDFGNLNTSLRYLGGSDSHTVGEMLSAMKRHARQNNTYAEWMRGQGVGLTTLVQHYSRNMDGMGLFAKGAQWASNKTFEYNGLELSGRAVQGAYQQIAGRIAGDAAFSGKEVPAFQHWRSVHNISDAEWAQMAKYHQEIEGLEGHYLTPDMIEDVALARKLHMAQRAGMDFALIQPSVSSEAIMRFGTQAGTIHGELLRTVMQYKSYPIDVVRRISRRFNNGYAENGLTERLIWMGTMIGLATVALSLKDMTRGTEPLNPLDKHQWTWNNINRIMGQATVGPMAVGESLVTKKAPGAFLGGVAGIGAAAVKHDKYQLTTRTFNMMPGSSAPGVTAAFRMFLQQVKPEVYQDSIQRIYSYNLHRTGQDNIFRKK